MDKETLEETMTEIAETKQGYGKKCTACGSHDLFEFKLNLAGLGKGQGAAVVNNTEVYACAICGHLEFYASRQAMQTYNYEKLKQKKQQKQAIELETKKAVLEEEIQMLEAVIKDKKKTSADITNEKIKLEAFKAGLFQLKKAPIEKQDGSYSPGNYF